MSSARRGDGSLIAPETRARVKKLGEPIALFLGRLGLSPNVLTLLGFAITVGGAVLAALGLWLAAGVVIFAGGAFDLLDGTLARAAGKVSKVGAFMDSVFDRSGEGITYVGIVIGGSAWTGLPILAAFAMTSAFLVSYVRAKSEGLGFTSGSGMAQVGLAPREIRLVILAVGLVATGLLGGTGRPLLGLASSPEPFLSFRDGSWALGSTLALIGFLATITVIQRILHVRRQVAGGGGK
jgi:phosphatidylglycerophosphate synthase